MSNGHTKIFLTGNKDVDRIVLEKSSDTDILQFCKTNKHSHEIICNENFFHKLILDRYPETIKYKDYIKIRDWKNHYLTVVHYIGKLNEDYKIEYKGEGSPEIEYLARFLTKSKFYSYNPALTFASAKGELAIVKYLIDHGAGINSYKTIAIKNAVINNHLAVVKYLTEHGAIVTNNLIELAENNGHYEIANYLRSVIRN